MKIKIISILLFFTLSISSLTIASADSMIINSNYDNQKSILNTQQKIEQSNVIKSHTSRQFNIDLTENFGIAENKNSQQAPSAPITNISMQQKTINLSERINVLENDLNPNTIALVKQSFVLKTTTDRIWNTERIRFNGKSIVTTNVLWNEQTSNVKMSSLINDLQSFEKSINDHITNNLAATVEKIIFVKPISDISLIAQNNIILFSTNSNSIENDIVRLAHDVTDTKNPTIFLLLVPLSGYILFRSEEEKFQFFNTRKIVSFCFIVILISSTVVTPISISPGFLNSVYAETMNGTSTNATNNAENNITLPLQSTSNTTQIGPQADISNDTLQNETILNPISVLTNATNSTLSGQINVTDTNSTGSSLVGPITNSTTEINSTNPSIPDQISVTDEVTLNSTGSSLVGPITNSTTEINSTNPSIPVQISVTDEIALNYTNINKIPNATKSWEFNSIQNVTTVGSAKIQNNTNVTSLKLAGSGYLTENVNSTRNLSELTISAWVKPDYRQGSPQFTIISKENQFTLSINNIISPAKIATFSVFDGIKWSTVNSTVSIEENWTQLAATFNGSSISIYVNGTLQSTRAINDIPTLAVNGQLTTKTVDQISSDADIVIGAYLNTLRGAASNKFSGSIQNVNLYDSLLTPSQIAQLYNNNILSDHLNKIQTLAQTNSTSDANPLFSEQVAILDNISVNSTSLTNATAIPITPSLKKLKNSYLITENPEFEFQYFNNATIAKLGKVIKKSLKHIQDDNWTDTKKTINIEIFDPTGKKIHTKSEFKELVDGKFDITLSSTRNVKPGIYKVKITMTMNGHTFVTTDQYAWGLVSLNTEKSIYRPNETANLVIVVLDNNGTSVCNADISMKITNPTLQNTILSSGHGITPGECGLYNAQYVTSSEGNYTVNVVAKSYAGITNFSTYFMVQKNFNYDVVRTAESKIDPFNNPNNFNVKINVKSFVGSGLVTIKEYVPNVFNVTTDGSVNQIGDVKVITWQRNLDSNNSTIVYYNYSVPLVTPQLYALGKVEIDQNNMAAFTEARNWFVAVDPTVAYTIGDPGIGTDANSLTIFTWSNPNSATCTPSTTQAGSTFIANTLALTPTSGGLRHFCYIFATPITISSTKQYVFSSITTNTGDFSSITTSSPSGSVAVAGASSLSATYHIAFTQPLSETLTSSDAVSTKAAKQASLAETLTSSDAVSKSVKKQLAETLSSSDAVSTIAGKIKSLAETLTSSDAVSTKAAKQASLAETLTSSDAVSTKAAKQASLAETLTSSDAVSTKAAK
ncbi:MAG: hypothetical protein HY223_07135, partial [Thaumarchaeota archaeon]|nr:hypothetical protein [Nitrososphaerota archaeon]